MKRTLRHILFGQMSGSGVAPAVPWYQNGSALANSVVALWKLDEASGARADSVGANTLTDNNTVGSAVGHVYPLAANLVAANSEYLSIADNAALSMGDVSCWVAVWLNLTSLAAPQNIFAKFLTTGNQREYRLIHNSSRFQWAVSSDGVGGTTVTLSANTFGAPTTGVNYFVMVWHDSANDLLGISVNGGAADTVSHTLGIFSGTAPFHIGALGVPGGYLDALIGPVTVGKNYVPLDADRTFLYNGGLGRT